MNIIRFNNIVSKNKYWIFLGLIFAIITYLLTSYGIITSTYDYFFPKPVYIIKTRIENIPANISGKVYNANLNEKGFQSRIGLIDTCGDMALIQILVPADSPLITWSNKDFVRVGQQNLTYSISIFTRKRDGMGTLKISSYDTKFSVEKHVAVKKVSSSEGVEGLYEELWEIDLSHLSENYKTLFDLIPEKDKKINIECLGIKNCKITELKYIISDFQSYIYDGKLTLQGTDIFGRNRKVEILLPPSNFDRISIYQLDESNNKFIKISLEDPKNATNIMYFSPLPCNPEGKVYIHELGT